MNVDIDTCTIELDAMKDEANRIVKKVDVCVSKELDTATILHKDVFISTRNLLHDFSSIQSKADDCIKDINQNSGIYALTKATVCIETVSISAKTYFKTVKII